MHVYMCTRMYMHMYVCIWEFPKIRGPNIYPNNKALIIRTALTGRAIFRNSHVDVYMPLVFPWALDSRIRRLHYNKSP